MGLNGDIQLFTILANPKVYQTASQLCETHGLAFPLQTLQRYIIQLISEFQCKILEQKDPRGRGYLFSSRQERGCLSSGRIAQNHLSLNITLNTLICSCETLMTCFQSGTGASDTASSLWPAPRAFFPGWRGQCTMIILLKTASPFR